MAYAGAACATPKTGAAKKAGAASCQSGKAASQDSDDEDDNEDDDEGVRFAVGDGCAKVTAGVTYTYQGTRQVVGVPRIVNRNGTVTQNTMSQSVTASSGLEYTRQTSLGEFKSTIAGEWSKSTDDGTTNGSAYFTGWSVGLGGLTVGYTGSLMSFWEGNFLTSASSPSRSATTIVYEHQLDAANKLAAGVESNLPTSPNADTNIWEFDFSNPIYSLRWRRETDALTTHLSGIVRRADFSSSPILPLLPNTAGDRTGWAASFGLKVPVKFIADGDEVSAQATYAVDASSYLGTTNDLVVYQSIVRSVGPTKGWSAVASYHHEWSDEWESNVFASFVSVKADLLLADPESKTFRAAVNVYWKPVKHLKFGAELGYVDMTIAPNGVAGYFTGNGGRAYIGTLSVSAEL
ncbi:MAG: porin [Proteobacteria bacterium]|nr:porin [Pseudomonadota bacterium]